jgi:hypothetical protein
MKKILWLFLLVLVWSCDKKDSPSHREITIPENPTSIGNGGPSFPSDGRRIQVTSLGLSLGGKDFLMRGFSVADPWHFIKRKWRNDTLKGLSIFKDHIANGFLLGGNTVRIPLLPRDEYKEGFLDWHKKYLNEILSPLVSYITRLDKFVILDNHWVRNWNEVDRLDLYLWADLMITHFGNNPKVIFEVFNEPIKPDNWKDWASYIQPMIDQFQKVDNLLLVGGPYWSSHMAGADQLPLKGKNIAYTGHIYSNQSESAWFKNYPTKRPIVFTETGFERGGVEGGDIDWAQNFYNRFLKDKSFIWWCLDREWGPRMIDEKGGLTAAGEFYKAIV